MIIQQKTPRLMMGGQVTSDIVAYFIIMLTAQVVATYLAAQDGFVVGLVIGGASIFTWLLVFGFYTYDQRQAERRKRWSSRVWNDGDAILKRFNDSFQAVGEDAARDPTNTFRTMRRRALLALARKRRQV
jgi:hypothetical protein